MIRPALTAVAAAAALAGPAHAAFPGTNGKVAFQRNQTAGTDQVHVANPDGSGRVQVTRPQHYMYGTDGFVQPSFSPDGTRLVVLSQSGGRLWTVYANGAQLRKLDAFTNQQVAEQPTFTPDGSRILFGMTDISDLQKPVPMGIHSVRASDGGDLRRHTSGNDFDPVMSPDGTKLAFGRNVSDGGGDASLFVAEADGANPVAIYEGHGMDEYPNSLNWSPDSQSIVFAKFQNGVYVIPAAGGEVRTISRRCEDPASCGYDSQPVYSPDGTKILFNRTYLGKVGESENTSTLYVAPADGLGAASTLFAGTTDSGPSWGAHSTAPLPEPEPGATSGKPNTDGPGGISPGEGTTTTTTVTEDGTGLDARVLTVHGRRALGALFTRRGLQVPVGVSVAGTIRLEAHTVRGKRRRVAAGTASSGRGGVVMVRLKATKAGRRLRRVRSLKLQIRGSFRSTKGLSVKIRARRVTLTR